MSSERSKGSEVARPIRRGRRGFTLLELAIAMSILLIGMVSVVTATSRIHSLRRQNRERTLAQNAVRSLAERIQARAWDIEEPEDWAREMLATFGPAGEFGDSFDVLGLSPPLDENRVGSLEVLTDETVTDTELGFEVGMPRDLNGDGDAGDFDVSDDARLLPVLLEVDWRGIGGESTYRHAFYVMGS